jgi:hypothetical protein
MPLGGAIGTEAERRGDEVGVPGIRDTREGGRE